MRIDSPEIVGEITLPATSSGHFSGSFEGDGSNLTGIVATVLDIDAFGDDLTGATLAGADKMILSDGGTEGRVTVSQLSTPLAGTGLEANAGTIRIATAAAGDGLSGGGGSALAVNVDDSTIETNADTLRVKDAGITEAKLATSVAGDGLAGGGGTALSVNVDDSTIETNADTLRVKDSGITEAKLNTSVAGDGLAGGAGTALSVNVDDSTIEINSDSLRIKDSGVTNAKLTNSSVAIGNQTITLGAAATTELTGLTNISAISASFVHNVYESASVIYSSGSNIFGDKANDTQQVTGSLLLTGSFIATSPGATINGAAIVTGSAQIDHDATTNFVANEHINHTSVTLTAGDGLSGGGDISANRSFAVNVDNSSIEINADTLRVKASGVTNAMLNGSIANDKLTNSSITINGTSVSLGGTLSAAQTLNGSISGSVQVDHDATTNFVANEHIDHSGVSITAGDGLTGGGTIASSRTINVGAGTLIDVTADAVNVDLSELATSTTNGDGDYFVVVDTANAQRKLTKGNIAISGFNNDSGYITSAGSIAGNAATATKLATARTIAGVSFDGSANIALNNNAITNGAGYITSAGNAATATTLATARTINGVSFNGSANITVEAYIEDDNSTNATRYITFVDNSTANYKRLNEDSNLTYNPSTNTLSAGTFSGTLSGNASTATTLATARTIAGVSFDGSANIALNNNAITNGAGYTTYTANQGLDNNDNVHFEGLMVGQTTGATANTIRCVGDVVAYYSSDAQFKDNVETLEGALDKVKAIRGVRFDWNDKQDVHTGHDIGVIAQEVETVLPELVHHREHNDSKAVDYVKLTAVLIEAIKELSAKVEELEKK